MKYEPIQEHHWLNIYEILHQRNFLFADGYTRLLGTGSKSIARLVYSVLVCICLGYTSPTPLVALPLSHKLFLFIKKINIAYILQERLAFQIGG